MVERRHHLHRDPKPGRVSDWMLPFCRNVTSQDGQDGILERLFEIMPPANRWCAELGAWDGKHLSNTWNLINNHGWSAVLIEPGQARFGELSERYGGNERVHLVNRFAAFTPGKDTLDDIFAEACAPLDMDFLSIDIDGNDWHLWDGLERYRPRVLMIEFNPTIAMDVHFVQACDPAINQGSSLRAMVNLGKSKGYELIGVQSDAFFVVKEEYERFGLPDNDIDLIYETYADTQLHQGFDGSIILNGHRRLIWQGMALDENDVQVLPKAARKRWWLD